MSLPHNEQELGKTQPSRKKRGTVFIVIVITIVVHVLALGGLAAIKIIEVLNPPPEFEAPPVVEMDTPPPPPPPPPPTTKRSQKSLPRPQPLAAQNPQNLSVPAIVMEESDMAFGRGFGGGLGELGGGIMDRVDISFFGIEGGNNIVVLFDRTGSGAGIFKRTRAELMKTIEAMGSNPGSRLAVIYFGGKEAGMRGINKKGIDPTTKDFWWPRSVTPNRWLSVSDGDAKRLVDEINQFKDPAGADYVTDDPSRRDKGKNVFVLGTNYWGALKAAYLLDPAPQTVYFMVEPDIAFPNAKIVQEAFAVWKKYGVPKPKDTKVVFVVAKPARKVKDRGALNLMVRLINGGQMTPKQINDLIVY